MVAFIRNLSSSHYWLFANCWSSIPLFPIELREAFDFNTTDDVRQFIQPMVDSGEVSIRDVKQGWIIVKEKGTI